MEKLNTNKESVRKALDLLNNVKVSDEKKLSLLLAWDWSYDEIVELAYMADK
jgi:hypothetical protein